MVITLALRYSKITENITITGEYNHMNLDNIQVRDFLVERGIYYLYHANTVLTSCTFLRNGGLLSRGYVEDNGLLQTPQQSDDIDKKYGIQYDIFFDDCDIHLRSNNVNYYGPVLFKFSVDVLLAEIHSPVKITKRNPLYWKNVEPSSEYFNSIVELEADYCPGDFGQIITLHEANVFPFEPYLIEIIVDNPQRNIRSKPPCDLAIKALPAAANQGQVKTNICKRACSVLCNCNNYYDSLSYSAFCERFLP